jgi:hypothetical protein
MQTTPCCGLRAEVFRVLPLRIQLASIWRQKMASSVHWSCSCKILIGLYASGPPRTTRNGQEKNLDKIFSL